MIQVRWKLRHISAMVVLAAVLLAIENRRPMFLAGVGLLGLFLTPPVGMAWAWDRFIRRIEGEDRPTRRLGEKAWPLMAWFACFLMPWSMIVAFVVQYLDNFD